MRPNLLLFLCLAPAIIFCQEKPALNDSLARLLKKDSLHIFRETLAKPYLKGENRNSFIISEPVDFYGGMAGATFWNRHTIAAGFYFLDKKSRRILPMENKPGASQQFLRLTYFNFAYQLVVLNKKFVQLNLPLEIGVGSFYAKTLDSSSVGGTRHHSGQFIPFSAGVQCIGKITRWLGISGAGGYRYVRNDDVLLKFNGLYFSFGVWVDARHLLRSYKYFRAKKKYFEMQSPHSDK